MIPILFNRHLSLSTQYIITIYKSLFFGVSRVHYHDYDRHYYHCQTAEGHAFLVGVLLILVGLLEESSSFLQVQISFLHFL